MKVHYKNIKFHLRPVCLLIVLSLNSCITANRVTYLQDMDNDSQIELENKFEAVIVPYDELTILVSAYNEELAKPFNVVGGHSSNYSSNNNYNSGYGAGYLVDVNGNIEFPVLGELHVAGMTRLQIQNMIKKILEEGDYIKDPFVYVRFRNYKIFFLGSDGGKAITIPNERCNFLEALSLSGDLDVFTRRDKIGVLREEDGKMVMHYLDPRSSDIFNDPYFMLRQNDFIITESIHSKYTRDNLSYWASWTALIISLVTSILLFTK